MTESNRIKSESDVPPVYPLKPWLDESKGPISRLLYAIAEIERLESLHETPLFACTNHDLGEYDDANT